MNLLERSARISDCGRYRYTLLRRWGTRPKGVTWIMLNPSTADAEIDDPTIRRCMTFTERLGYNAMMVVNLFALRATHPVLLLDAEDPVGEANPIWLRKALHQGKILVAAWGVVKKPIRSGVDYIVKLMREDGYNLKCLGTTKDGSPRHPLYVRGDAPLVEWKPNHR